MSSQFDNFVKKLVDGTKAKRAQGKTGFEDHDQDLCMLCDAYGEDKRSLFIDCFYDVQEVVPEAFDLGDVEKLKDRGYYLRICKNCRGELLAKLGGWRNEMVARRSISKDHDGHDAAIEEGKDIPVRINGRIIYMTEPQFNIYKEKHDKPGDAA